MENTEILKGLNPQQKMAVEHLEGPVLIVAGAGSGKTRVLTSRIAYAISKGYDPSRIMALTFTKKAAGEMKERIAQMVGMRQARKLYMGTFHSVFIRFLRDYAEQLQYPRDFTIYDTSDSLSLIKTCLKQLNLDSGADGKENKHYKPKDVLSRISEAKNALVSPSQYLSNSKVQEADFRSKKPRMGEIYSLYWKKCRESGVMDFDDVLFNMNYLLSKNEEARKELSARFDLLMVDEYQDTNFAQYRILKLLCISHSNICVVGDDSQSIYAFRGAKVENILRFEKEFPNTKVYRLEQNYRSTQTIVDAANSLIEKNQNRIKKVCFSEAEKGELIRIVRAFTDQEEAFMVTSSIMDRIHSSRAEYKDFAILYRTNAQSRLLEEQLRKRNIPYMIYSGNSFFDRAEVKDVMAYLKLLANLNDNESFKRIINKPTRGIGATSLAAIQSAALANNCSLFEAALNPAELASFGLKSAAYARVEQFCKMILSCKEKMEEMDAYDLAVKMALDSGIWMLYKSDTSQEGKTKAENVQELLDSVKAFVEEKQSDYLADLEFEEAELSYDAQSLPLVTLGEYLENISLLSAVDIDEGDDSDNKVALMTVHSSKGLEYPYVYITGLEENLFPSGGMLTSPSEIEEERRLFYVALTRAGKAVTLSYCNSRMRNGQHESNPPSRFIREIDSCYLQNPLPSVKTADVVAAQARATDSTGFRPRGMNAFSPKAPGGVSQAPKTSPVTRPVSRISANNRPTKEIVPSSILDIKVGHRVEHGKYGYGKVESLTQDGNYLKANVRFDEDGLKVLILQYAKLRIVE